MNEKRQYFIYTLIKGETVFYVGITDDISRRLKDHIRDFGGDIKIEKIDEYFGLFAPACSLEEYWIKNHRQRGFVLKNIKNEIMDINLGCLNCGENVLQTRGKRKKIFCNNTCRSNYWQKTDRLEKEGKSTEEIVLLMAKLAKNNKPENKKRILEERNTVSVKNFTQPQPPSNYTINTNVTAINKIKDSCPSNLKGLARTAWIYDEKKKQGLIQSLQQQLKL